MYRGLEARSARIRKNRKPIRPRLMRCCLRRFAGSICPCGVRSATLLRTAPQPDTRPFRQRATRHRGGTSWDPERYENIERIGPVGSNCLDGYEFRAQGGFKRQRFPPAHELDDALAPATATPMRWPETARNAAAQIERAAAMMRHLRAPVGSTAATVSPAEWIASCRRLSNCASRGVRRWL